VGDEKLLTTAELAEYLGVPVRTIYAWRSTGEGPRRIRVGKHLRFRQSDVAAFLERQAEPMVSAR
jgi:excisionase family DNA binding protein